MIRLRTGIAVLFLGLLPLQTQADGLPSSPVAQAQLFADCAGRYTALVYHQFFFDGDAAEDADLTRNTFIQLLEAVLPDAISDGLPPQQSLNWRVQARATQAVLLHRADFHSDPLVSGPARARADLHLADCRQLILPGA